MSRQGNGKATLGAVPRPEGVPQAPEGLQSAGAAIWALVWGLNRVKAEDAPSIERLCRLEDEAASLRAIVAEHGAMLERPLQNSRGEVIGTDRYAHPAVNALRKIGAEAGALSDALGLTPEGRRKLGMDTPAEARPPDVVDRLRAEVQGHRAEAKRRAQEAGRG